VVFSDLKITHHWERGIYKNNHLMKLQIQSAITYFNKWGWIWDKERKTMNAACRYYERYKMIGNIITFKKATDYRGALVALEGNKNVPFDIKRVYYIFETDLNFVRGQHAHKNLKQLMICTSGACTVRLDDGNEKEEVRLDRPDKGLYIENLIWREMYDFTPDCVMMVLTDQYYDPDDYIREYDDFLKAVKEAK
jgi:dTDP-4-dehydrorhamnose 3,5-epimerase-like enzyme